jgi:microcystin-dependent protein
MSIAQNTALFSLLGTTYGGNGVSTFQLPDLRGRVAMHVSAAHPQGQISGEETHTLTMAEVPTHTHAALCNNNAANSLGPAGAVWAKNGSGYATFAPTANSQCSPQAIAATGGQPHDNMAPTLTVNFCIALAGIFPSRN